MTDVDFAELLSSHSNSKALVTIGTIEHLIEVPFGVIETQNETLVSLVEKPIVSHKIYAGVGAYSELAFEGFQSNNPIDATDVYEKLLREGKEIRVFEISGYWRDIGTGESLQAAHRDLGLGTE